jgi:ubiquitin related modifier 1
MLFSNQRVHKISIPAKTADGTAPNIQWLINYLCTSIMKDPRKDLFVLDDTV